MQYPVDAGTDQPPIEHESLVEGADQLENLHPTLLLIRSPVKNDGVSPFKKQCQDKGLGINSNKRISDFNDSLEENNYPNADMSLTDTKNKTKRKKEEDSSDQKRKIFQKHFDEQISQILNTFSQLHIG